jgi:hypothetical protein
MPVKRSRPDTGLFGNVVQAGIRPGFGECIFRHREDALAVLLGVGTLFSLGHQEKIILVNGDNLRLFLSTDSGSVLASPSGYCKIGSHIS